MKYILELSSTLMTSLARMTGALRLFTAWAESQKIKSLGDVETEHIRKYQIHILSAPPRGLNSMSRHATWNRYRSVLNQLFVFHEKHGKLRVNPIVGVKEFRMKEAETFERVFSDEEIAALLESFDSDDNKRVGAFFRLLLYTGARASEAVTMLWNQIDVKRGLITITGESKTYRVRRIPIHPSGLVPFLNAICPEKIQRTDTVFPHGYRTTALSVNNWGKLLRRRLNALGFPPAGLHAFRRTFATQLARQGVNIATLQKLAGWKSIAMAQRYVRLNDNDTRQAILDLDYTAK